MLAGRCPQHLGHHFTATVHTDVLVDLLKVVAYGLLADVHLGGDLPVDESTQSPDRDLALPRRKAVFRQTTLQIGSWKKRSQDKDACSSIDRVLSATLREIPDGVW